MLMKLSGATSKMIKKKKKKKKSTLWETGF